MAGIGIDTSGVSSVVNNASDKSNNNSSLDKDAFLQLLVTQMQYQDPLQPTTNTEYMAQLAQFSTVEELQNMSGALANNQAMSMAGQYVILNVPDATGEISQVSGLVDYVTVSEGKTYFSIEDQYYPSDYLDSVVSIDYLEYLSNQMANGTTGGSTSEGTTTEEETTTDNNAQKDTTTEENA